jgi:hypothetical protein
MGGREIYFINGETNVPDEIGNELIKKPGYGLIGSDENKHQDPIQNFVKSVITKPIITKSTIVDEHPVEIITRMKHRDDIDVSIIVPTYNRLEDIKNCVASIYDNTKCITYEIVIVDGIGNA